MAGGLWSSGPNVETIQQPHMRHKLVIVNTGALAAGNVPPNPVDYSCYASFTPQTVPVIQNARFNAFEGGPHFIMSPRTPDGDPTLGFGFGVFSDPLIPVGTQATAIAGGFTITPWVYIDAAQGYAGLMIGTWFAMAPITGVQYNQLFSSFDINSGAIRFQFDIGTIAVGGSVGLAFVEL